MHKQSGCSQTAAAWAPNWGCIEMIQGCWQSNGRVAKWADLFQREPKPRVDGDS